MSRSDLPLFILFLSIISHHPLLELSLPTSWMDVSLRLLPAWTSSNPQKVSTCGTTDLDPRDIWSTKENSGRQKCGYYPGWGDKSYFVPVWRKNLQLSKNWFSNDFFFFSRWPLVECLNQLQLCLRGEKLSRCRWWQKNWPQVWETT